MTLQDHIDELEIELKQAKRRQRKDKGETRIKYDQSLPKRYRSYLMSANKRQLKFKLTIDEFNSILIHNCAFCGTGSSVGIDRIDSNEGYYIGNVQPCCTTCNMMKRNMQDEQFLRHLYKILQYKGFKITPYV